MAYKMKLIVTAALLLLGVTGVAFASGQVPGTAGGGDTTVTNSAPVGTATGPGGQVNDNAADDQHGNREATETGDDDSAASDEYMDDDATDMDDHGQGSEMDEHHQGNMGVGAEHANEHANVPETTPVAGGNAPAHAMDNEDGQSAHGGMTGSGTGSDGGNSYQGSGSNITQSTGSHTSSMGAHGRS